MSNSLQVLHIHSGNLYGGVETVMNTLVRCGALSPALEHHFALCFDGGLSGELEAMDARVYRLGKARTSQPLSIWRARRNLAQLLRRHKFDVAICHSSWSQALFGEVARQMEVPLIFWLHDEVKGTHWLERWAKRTRPDLAICNSRFTAGTVDRLYPGVKASVLYCPVAAPEIHRSAAERQAVRAELDTPENATVIIQVGRIEPLKGHAVHLRALSLLHDLPDWVCWQIGGAQRPREQTYFAQLKQLAAQLGIAERVRFVGPRADVARLLAAADVYCQPNVTPDAFGITFIEALYTPLPVVTTALGGAMEIVDDSCGMLTTAGDTRALAEALRYLLEDQSRRTKLSLNGAARAYQLCNPATQLALLQKLLTAPLTGSQVTDLSFKRGLLEYD